MKILKPGWVTHGHPKDEKIESCALFSVDIHPDGSRFATGGQGEDSGRIVIWNMAPILSEAKEMDTRVPLMLCTLDNHLACVNAVRWSHSGRYLASGGDDKLIMIWTISNNQAGSTIFGGKGKVNIEHWKCSHTLHGHTGDVLDIAWSPHDVWLATASVDNNIIIWNVERFPEVVTVLKGHTGLVKGVTWDPVGKYLSSQGDDRTLRVWRTVDWRSEAVIEEPFKQCAGSTIMLRCAWSPDGQYIVSAHSLNNGGPTAQVIERDGWSCDKDYVGHRKAVTAVRFIPNLVKRKCGLGNHQKIRHLSVLAIGSRDHGVSVWLGGYPRPLVVMEDLFTSAVLDLAWSPNGLALLACSYDGTLACFLFTQSEIGLPISMSERNELYEKMYGTSVKMSSTLGPGSGGVGNLLIENCELLPEAGDLKSEVNRKDKDRDKMKENSFSIENKQPVASQTTPTPTTPVSEHEKSREYTVPDEVLENGVLVRTSSSSCKSYPSPTRKQIETRTSDGRRRITPIYIPPTPDSCDGPAPFGSEPVLKTASKPLTTSSGQSSIVTQLVTNVAQQQNSTGSVFVTSTSNRESSQSIIHKPGIKRTLDCESSRQPQAMVHHESKRQRIEEATVVPKMCRVEKEEIVTVIKGDGGGVNLPPLSIMSLHEFNVSPGTVLIVDNKAYNLSKGTIVSVKLRKNNSVLWEHVFGYKIVGVSTSEKFAVLALLDTSVYVIDIHRGTFKTPTLYLGALATHVVLNKAGYLMVITNIGECYVWNVNTHTAILSKVSLAPLFSQYSMDKKNSDPSSIRIKYGTLSDDGIPMIALTTGKAFVYSQSFQCWSLVVDSTSGVVKNISQQIKLSSNSRVSLPLSTLHASCQNNSRVISIHNPEVSPLCTQSLLESQLSACATLSSPTEYRQWLLTMVHYYIQAGAEHRLRTLCEDLLGPSHGYATLSSTWEPKIMGLDKHVLLDEILSEVGKSIHCQRLYTEFREQLNTLQAMAAAKQKIQGEPIRSTYVRGYSANIANIVGSTGDGRMSLAASRTSLGDVATSRLSLGTDTGVFRSPGRTTSRVPSIEKSIVESSLASNVSRVESNVFTIVPNSQVGSKEHSTAAPKVDNTRVNVSKPIVDVSMDVDHVPEVASSESQKEHKEETGSGVKDSHAESKTTIFEQNKNETAMDVSEKSVTVEDDVSVVELNKGNKGDLSEPVNQSVSVDKSSNLKTKAKEESGESKTNATVNIVQSIEEAKTESVAHDKDDTKSLPNNSSLKPNPVTSTNKSKDDVPKANVPSVVPCTKPKEQNTSSNRSKTEPSKSISSSPPSIVTSKPVIAEPSKPAVVSKQTETSSSTISLSKNTAISKPVTPNEVVPKDGTTSEVNSKSVASIRSVTNVEPNGKTTTDSKLEDKKEDTLSLDPNSTESAKRAKTTKAGDNLPASS
uniref:Protein HIRA n=1 Tax=Cacopsylla melanoneura TaxID=428564 RepID=A0A8D8YSY3_9HEMI